MAEATGLADDPASWPERLRLREFSYETLDPDLARSVSKRLAWIRRDVEGYILQPYEELIAADRRCGHEGSPRGRHNETTSPLPTPTLIKAVPAREPGSRTAPIRPRPRFTDRLPRGEGLQFLS